MTLKGFFKQCVENASLCPLAEDQDTTPESLLERFNDVLSDLAQEQGTYATTRYFQFKQTVFSWLYNPNNFLRLPAMINSAFQGNFTLLDDAIAEGDPSLDTYNQGINAWEGTVCSDSTFRATSIDDVLAIAGEQQTVGGFMDTIAPRLWTCANWKFEPAERFTGPFEGKTVHPILFANGIYDPGTPMEVAVNMSRAYEDAGLLVHKGFGVSFCSQTQISNVFSITYTNELTARCDESPFELHCGRHFRLFPRRHAASH